MLEGIYQVRIHSRGGQGAKTAGRLIAESFIAQGEFAQAFSEYGPERSGAPMKTFLRLSDKEIKLHGDVQNPDMVVVLDPSLLGSVNVIEGIEDKGVVLVNTSEDSDEIAKKFANKNIKIYTLDASGIATRIIGKNLPNTVVMGAMTKILSNLKYEEVLKRTKSYFSKKLSDELLRSNLDAMKEGYNFTK